MHNDDHHNSGPTVTVFGWIIQTAHKCNKDENGFEGRKGWGGEFHQFYWNSKSNDWLLKSRVVMLEGAT